MSFIFNLYHEGVFQFKNPISNFRIGLYMGNGALKCFTGTKYSDI